MKFEYVESQKPTRNKHIWVISMAEAGINIKNVARHFGIHKTNAYRTTGLAGDHPKSRAATPIIKVYTDVRLEGVSFSGLQIYEWVSFSHQKYVFSPKKYLKNSI